MKTLRKPLKRIIYLHKKCHKIMLKSLIEEKIKYEVETFNKPDYERWTLFIDYNADLFLLGRAFSEFERITKR